MRKAPTGCCPKSAETKPKRRRCRGIAGVFVRPPSGLERPGVCAVVAGMGVGEFGQGHAGAILEREQEVAVGPGEIRLDLQRARR